MGLVAETVTVFDAFSSQGNLEANIAEVVTAEASPLGNIIYNIDIEEAASAFDLLTQRKLWETINTSDEAVWVVIRTRTF